MKQWRALHWKLELRSPRDILATRVPHAKEDVHARALAESRVDGQRLLEATRSAMASDAGLLSADERSDIEGKMNDLDRLIAGGGDPRAIKQAIEALNHATEEFAARRMDEGVRRALAGRKIGSL